MCRARKEGGDNQTKRRPNGNHGNQRGNSNNGLAATDISLNQPGHRLRPIQIQFNLRENPLLRSRELKRQQLQETPHQAITVRGTAQGRSGALSQRRPSLHQPKLQQ